MFPYFRACRESGHDRHVYIQYIKVYRCFRKFHGFSAVCRGNDFKVFCSEEHGEDVADLLFIVGDEYPDLLVLVFHSISSVFMALQRLSSETRIRGFARYPYHSTQNCKKQDKNKKYSLAKQFLLSYNGPLENENEKRGTGNGSKYYK